MRKLRRLFHRLLCRNQKVVIIGEYIDWVKDNHYQKKYIHRCKKCGKEW